MLRFAGDIFNELRMLLLSEIVWSKYCCTRPTLSPAAKVICYGLPMTTRDGRNLYLRVWIRHTSWLQIWRIFTRLLRNYRSVFLYFLLFIGKLRPPERHRGPGWPEKERMPQKTSALIDMAAVVGRWVLVLSGPQSRHPWVCKSINTYVSDMNVLVTY